MDLIIGGPIGMELHVSSSVLIVWLGCMLDLGGAR